MRRIKLNPTMRIILNTIFVLFSVILLTYPAIYNGYPLLYSDSASYIVSGHDGNVPIDRPIIYGLFVRHISLSFSLWFVVILQALFIIALVYYSFHLFIKSKDSNLYSFLTILILSVFTGLPNYVSQIMPDLFTGVMIWTTILLFFSEKKLSRTILIVGISFSAIVHNSNLLTMSIIVMLIFLVAFIFKIKQMKKQLPFLASLVVFLWLLVPSVNYLFMKEWYVSKSGNVFLMGKMIQTGIIKDYLDEECQNNNYELCLFKDSLPKYAYEFLWNDNSPLYYGDCAKEGGWSTCWKVKSGEYRKIILGALKKPHLLSKYLKISTIDVGRQIVYFDMIHFSNLGGKGSAFDEIIKCYFDDYNLFVKSKQYTQTIFYRVQNSIQRIAIVASTFIIILLAFAKKTGIKKILKITTLVLSIGLVVNAAICATLAIVEGRYQGRIIWLIPLLCCIFIAIYFEDRKLKKSDG
jgi:hypothetical protein